MITLLIFLAVLAVLVISHEFGHFFVARSNGIAVDEFGFGFPPRLGGVRRIKTANGYRWQWVWGSKDVSNVPIDGTPGTLYSINWIPLGGFVRIKGEDGASAADPDSFASKKLWRKASVLVAGVFMNVLVAVFLLSLGFMIGLPQAATDSSVQLTDTKVEVLQAMPGKPAEAAGIQPGDIIVAIGDISYPRLGQLQEYVDAHKNETITVKVLRDKEEIIKNIHPIVYPDTGKGGIGVAIAEVGIVKYPWYKAIYYGFTTTLFYLKQIFLAFFYLLKGLVMGAGVGSAVSGPVGVAVMTGEVARMGIVYLLQFTAMLSLNLAILNILPIPALDGGRLLFVIIGSFARRSIAKIEQTVHAVGFVLLMVLVVAITVRDIHTFGNGFIHFFQKIF